MIFVKNFTIDKFLSNCYVVYRDDSASVIVIDPFISEELFSFIEWLCPNDVMILITHEHFDHTTGVNEVKRRFGAKLYCGRVCADKIRLKRNNRSLSVMGNALSRDMYKDITPYECITDVYLDADTYIDWNGIPIFIKYTPGHTSSSCCIIIEKYAFCGDSALLGIPTVTRFPSGSQEQYESFTVPFLLNLDKHINIMPGHGDSFMIADVIWENGCFQLRNTI